MKRLAALFNAFGPGALLAGVLALAAGGLAGVLAPHWQQQATALQQQADASARVLRQARQVALKPPPAPVKAAAELPGPANARQRLADLLLLAQRHGVQVAQTEQRLVRDARLGQEHWAVAMPAQARYEDLRRFLEAALRADPALALNSLRLQRERPDVEALQADLQWALHQQPAAQGDSQ